MANYNSALTNEDRDRFRQFIRDTVDVDAPSPVFTEETTKVIAQLLTVAQYGHDPEQQQWAERTLKNLSQDGARGHVEQVFKADKTVFRKPATTAAVPLNVPARVGIRREKAYQQSLWWELTWEEFDNWLELLGVKAARLQAKADAFAEVNALRVKYPDTKTPIEAMDIEGIDPRSFDLAA